MAPEHVSHLVRHSLLASVLVGVVASVGCNFDATSQGEGGGPALVDDSGTTQAPVTTVGVGVDDDVGSMTGGGTTTMGPLTSGPMGTTTTMTGAEGGSTSGGEIPPCMGPGDCPPEAPHCGPDGICYDGTKADPCVEGGCTAPLLCGPNGQCQDGAEGDPCADGSDCSAAASICSVDSQCHDGSEEDPCGSPADCNAGAPICSSYGECQDGSEEDSCNDSSDCGPEAPHCPWDDQCHNGSPLDPCINDDQCFNTCFAGYCTLF